MQASPKQLFVPLPETLASCEIPASFPSPFDELGPAPLARAAAEVLQAEFVDAELAPGISAATLFEPGAGKMFGVLVAADPEGRLGFLRAFSGMLGGAWQQPGFAPPIFDASDRASVEIDGERTVKELTAGFESAAASDELRGARAGLAAFDLAQAELIGALRTRHGQSRRARRQRRRELGGAASEAELERLAGQSRADKAERRRLDQARAVARQPLAARLERLERRLAARDRLRRMVSRALMRRIHDCYSVVSAAGETRPLRSLFAPVEPPSGAGDCAGPKLLAAAFAAGLRPLAMAEFWWGAPPATGGRVSGAFYPACKEKCRPLLPFMLEGLDVAAERPFVPLPFEAAGLDIVYEDERIVVVDKPCGLLSVPGRGAAMQDSVLTRLRERYPAANGPLLVHRLDLDTSGLLVAALDTDVHRVLQEAFAKREVDKRYVAVVDGSVTGDSGRIDLALSLDPFDRPRRIHDPVSGRAALTQWRVLARGEEGTRVELRPLTGRTHQLRVHAAHPSGLAAPVVGDRLYGRGGGRLLLHAEALAFVHPQSGNRVEFTSPVPF